MKMSRGMCFVLGLVLGARGAACLIRYMESRTGEKDEKPDPRGERFFEGLNNILNYDMDTFRGERGNG